MVNWDSNNLPSKPGLYVNIVQAAQTKLRGGNLGVVAIPLVAYSGTAVAEKLYTVANEVDAEGLFGALHIQSIKLALDGGCREVLVYTLPTIDGTTVTEQIAYDKARAAFDTRLFNVFVYDGGVTNAEQSLALAWVKKCRLEGKDFIAVFGGDATSDQTVATGIARATTLKDDYTITLINGAIINGQELPSEEYAAYIAGAVASCPLSKSITYAVVSAEDVNKRLTISETKDALAAGCVVLTNDGEKVKVEQGLATSGRKIRSVKLQQTLLVDLTKQIADNYIGKITNNADGQKFLISMVKLYLEQLALDGVLQDEKVVLDPNNASVGDSVFLSLSYQELDSMERIFLTINV